MNKMEFIPIIIYSIGFIFTTISSIAAILFMSAFMLTKTWELLWDSIKSSNRLNNYARYFELLDALEKVISEKPTADEHRIREIVSRLLKLHKETLG